MLSSIATLPWHTLRHAYGPADTIPWLVLDLTSKDSAARQHARGELYAHLLDEGMRCEAAPYVIPFLYEALAAPGTPDKNHVIYLLAGLALGDPQDHLPGGFDPAACRAAAAALTAEERADAERTGRGPLVDLACYEAARGGIHTLINLLDDEDPPTQTAAAFALAWFPEHAGESRPRLIEGLADAEPTAHGLALVLAAGLLDRRAPAAGPNPLAAFVGHASPALRLAARLGLARAPLAEEDIAALLAPTLDEEPFQFQGYLPFHDDSLAAYARKSIVAYGTAERAVPILCDALAGAQYEAMVDLVDLLLRMAFDGAARSPRPASSLTPLQTAALRAIARNNGWQWAGSWYQTMLREFGLPGTREELQGYLAGCEG